MRLFDRVVRVEIDSATERLQIGNVRVQFDVRKTRSKTPNQSEIKLYNLSRRTQLASEATGAVVRLLAGYDGQPILVTQTAITRVIVEDSPPDSVTILDCQDGIVPLRNTRVSLSFANGATVGQVLDAVRQQMGVILRPVDVNLSVPLRGGYSHVGAVSTVLNDLTSRINGSWSIQDGDLQILGSNGQSPNEVLFLSPSSGLIQVPEPIQDETDSEKIKRRSVSGYRLKALLQPQMSPGDRVIVESARVNGTFTVDEVQHIGDTRGNEFYTILTVLRDE